MLKRVSRQPIFISDTQSDWECYNVFNPAVIHHRGLFHMLYRAQGVDWISRLGYAVSVDGIHWNRLREPVLGPTDGFDSRGVEDPRVVEIDGTFFMTYTAYGSQVAEGCIPTHAGGSITPMIAKSTNLIQWEKVGHITVGEDNKDHFLFPRKINGRYVAFHRRHPNVWIAYSDNLIDWDPAEMKEVYGPRSGDVWDAKSVGSNGIPIETPHGWLQINHGYNHDHIYKFGVVLLDLDDPSKVIRRPTTAIFEPEELWELRGDVPNVVFSNANPLVGDTVYVYYGGGDHVIGLATAKLDDLIDFALNG
ncbi:MAG: glycosidase [Anaerolineaceae bacterium]|nr:glycosidase [Anaerolineaceae bacterium]